MNREEAKIWATIPREKLAVIAPRLAKHFETLCAFANGATIEAKDSDAVNWFESESPYFYLHREYRVKPSEEAQAAGAYKPNDGEHYYYVSDHGAVIHTVCSSEEQIHKARFSFRNCFKTQEEAFAALDRVRDALKGEKVSKKETVESTESLDGDPLTDGEKTLLRHLRDSKVVDIFNGETATTVIFDNEKNNACFAEAVEYIKEEREAV